MRKWLLGCSYKPHEFKKENQLNKIKIILDSLPSKYENFFLMGDFNSEPIEETMSDVIWNYMI